MLALFGQGKADAIGDIAARHQSVEQPGAVGPAHRAMLAAAVGQREAAGDAFEDIARRDDAFEAAEFVDHEDHAARRRSEEHTSELQSLIRNSYAVFCLNKKTHTQNK